VRVDGGTVDLRRIARLDRLLGLTDQRHDVVPDDADADVVEVVVGEVGGVPRLLGQRMAFVAAGAGVEELPAAPGGAVDGRRVTSDEAIERGVERRLRALVGRDGAQQIAGVGRTAEDLSEGGPVFRDGRDAVRRSVKAWP